MNPVLVKAFEKSKPFKMVCGSYHNICFSYRLPTMEDNEQQSNVVAVAEVKVNKNSEEQTTGAHRDEDCPYLAQHAKMQGVIKRLRQELILKGPSKKERQKA
jgi:hypothetical protein